MNTPTVRASLRLLHGARRQQPQCACSCLCRRHSNQAPAGVFAFVTEPPCYGAAMNTPTVRASLRLLHGRCEVEAASRCVLMSLPPALQPGTGRCVCFGDAAAMNTPTDGTRLRLLHGARRKRTQGKEQAAQYMSTGKARCRRRGRSRGSRQFRKLNLLWITSAPKPHVECGFAGLVCIRDSPPADIAGWYSINAGHCI